MKKILNIIAISPIFPLSSISLSFYISDIDHYINIKDNYSYQVIHIFHNSMRSIQKKNLETSQLLLFKIMNF